MQPIHQCIEKALHLAKKDDSVGNLSGDKERKITDLREKMQKYEKHMAANVRVFQEATDGIWRVAAAAFVIGMVFTFFLTLGCSPAAPAAALGTCLVSFGTLALTYGAAGAFCGGSWLYNRIQHYRAEKELQQLGVR